MVKVVSVGEILQFLRSCVENTCARGRTIPSKGGGMRVQPLVHRVLLWTFMLSVLFCAPARAQVDTGTILGTVRDQSGGVLPGATVTLTHEGQGFVLTGVTREDGTFVFTPIRTGTYSVEVAFPGFRTSARKGFNVSIQQQAVADFSLQPGGIAEDVVVTADAPLLETGTGTVGQTLRSEMIEN